MIRKKLKQWQQARDARKLAQLQKKRTRIQAKYEKLLWQSKRKAILPGYVSGSVTPIINPSSSHQYRKGGQRFENLNYDLLSKHEILQYLSVLEASECYCTAFEAKSMRESVSGMGKPFRIPHSSEMIRELKAALKRKELIERYPNSDGNPSFT